MADGSNAGARELERHNRRFYDQLWRAARLVPAERFNTWPVVADLVAGSHRRLEIAPGLRPRLPLAGTVFADISPPALRALRCHGGHAVHASVTALPLASARFDLVCAFDVVEHVADDEAAFAEIARVATPATTLLLSVPLHPENWTPFDAFVGHHRRYRPQELASTLLRHGFRIERSAAYGMQPRSSRLLDVGMWFLTHQRERAMWWYNRVFMPLALRRQPALAWHDGLVDDRAVDTIVAVCRRDG
jgi:SAM-dependent methyltransferase